MVLCMNFAVDRGQGLDLSSLRVLVPVCFFGWSRQLPYKSVSSLLDISEVITREWYQLYGTELVDVSNAVCSFHFFRYIVCLNTPGKLFTSSKKTTVELLTIKCITRFCLILVTSCLRKCTVAFTSLQKFTRFVISSFASINVCGVRFFVNCRHEFSLTDLNNWSNTTLQT